MTGSRLAGTASPYLRAHAANPVPWFPWGAAAFDEARRRDVPVMISIGYSTCHWCHVMARESFEDPDTAAQLAADFVSIKVDREEHPDVDAAYLAAAGAFTPHLGWPLTVFTTPEGRAFHAGTYFPPAPRGGMPSFRQVLTAVSDAWRERRGEVEETSAALADALAAAATTTPADATPTADELVAAARRILALEDVAHGGFGSDGPKFPTVPVLRLLQTRPLGVEPAAAAERAVAAMAGSELYDPVDGGFFRYATRPDWTVPHYERMLTDNAGLIEVALDAGEIGLARSVAGFLVDVLQQPSGGFGAAQDSESWIDGERSEGGYYARDAAGRAGLDPPAVDGKVVTGWNGLAIGVLADLARRTGDAEVLDAAQAAADAVLESNVDAGGRLVRASLDEVASRAPAVLEDYGLLAAGLTRLAVATGEVAYATTARDLVDTVLVGDIAPDRVLAGQGTAVPHSGEGDHLTGRASIADAAYRLWLLGAGDTYRAAAVDIVRAGAAPALAEPFAHAGLLRIAAQLTASPRQVVVVAGAGDDLAETAREVVADLVVTVTPAQASAFAASGFSLFEGKTAVDGLPTAYDCRDFACRLPTHDPESLVFN